jgi:hypothetical protein
MKIPPLSIFAQNKSLSDRIVRKALSFWLIKLLVSKFFHQPNDEANATKKEASPSQNT